MHSDVELMIQVREGEIDKLALLFERYKKPMYAFFYRFSGSRETSEDLVQTLFYRVLKYRRKYSGEGKFSTWLYRIARNLAIDHYHSDRRISVDPLEKEPAAADDRADRILVKHEEISLLRQAMKQLTPQEREVLVLSRFQGLTYREIGEICNCPEGTVKARVFRAIQSLKGIYSILEG